MGGVTKIFAKKTLKAYPDTELVVYRRNSYVTITGNWAEGTPTAVRENKTYIQFLLQQLEAHSPKRLSIVLSSDATESAASVVCAPGSHPLPNLEATISSGKTKDQVIHEILRSGKITKGLFLGELDGNSWCLDLALCHKLVAFCDRDPLLIDAVLRESPHFKKHDRSKKWDKVSHKSGRTHGEDTIKKALDENKWKGVSQPGLKEKRLAFPVPELLGQEDLHKLRCTRKFDQTYKGKRPFDSSLDLRHTVRDYACSLLYSIQCAGLGPGKGYSLTAGFLAEYFPQFVLEPINFWYFWRRALHQVDRTGSATRSRITRKLESEQAPQNRRAFGKSVQVWLLKEEGKTGPEIASALGMRTGSVRRILYRIRKTYLGKKNFESAVQLARMGGAEARHRKPRTRAGAPKINKQVDPIVNAIIEGRAKCGHMITVGVAERIAGSICNYGRKLGQEILPTDVSRAAACCKLKNPNSILSAVKNKIAISWSKTDDWAHFLTGAYQHAPLFEDHRRFVTWKAAELANELMSRLDRVGKPGLDEDSKSEIREIISSEWRPRLVCREWELRQNCRGKGMGREEKLLENADARHDCGFAVARDAIPKDGSGATRL